MPVSDLEAIQMFEVRVNNWAGDLQRAYDRIQPRVAELRTKVDALRDPNKLIVPPEEKNRWDAALAELQAVASGFAELHTVINTPPKLLGQAETDAKAAAAAAKAGQSKPVQPHQPPLTPPNQPRPPFQPTTPPHRPGT